MPTALLGSCAIIALRLRFYSHVGLDRPNQRSLHQRPIPHGGGVGIVAASLVCGWVLQIPSVVLSTALGLALLSLLDDIRHLPSGLRLASHLAGAAAICAFLRLPVVLWLPAMLLVGWMTNVFNFMDGADGLAGTEGVAGFLAYAAGFAMAGQDGLALWSGAIAAACCGFLCFNWPPARIFMGDVGSIPLGFLAGALAILGVARGIWPVWFPLLAFAPFLLDASVTLVRRARAGKRVWEAHREHLYQRMVSGGLGHKGVAIRWGAVMSASAILAVGLLTAPPWTQGYGAGAWLTCLIAIGYRMERHLNASDFGGNHRD